MKFDYADLVSVETSTLPQASQDAMLRRGLVHFFGNEVASKVAGRATRHAEESAKAHKDTYGRGATPDEAVAFVATDEQKAEWRKAYIGEALDKLLAGTVGQFVRGPAVDPIESEMDKIAKQEVSDILRANGLKVPKRDETVKFSDKSEKTLDEMIANRLVSDAIAPGEKDGHAVRIRKLAEKAVKARKAAVDRAKATADAAKTKTAADLGL